MVLRVLRASVVNSFSIRLFKQPVEKDIYLRLLGWQLYCHPRFDGDFGGGSTTATPTLGAIFNELLV